jgi:nucleotide-binding universal stress UspA family protein
MERDMIKKILVPLDGSKLAENVMSYVEELALKLNAEAVFISVTNRAQGYWPFEDPSQPNEVRMVPQGICTMEEQAAQYLDQTAKGLEGKGLKITKEVICGKTAKEIVFYANDNHCDLIIISSHGRGGLTKFTHGNIATKILKLASVPVMVVKAAGQSE